MSMALVTQTKTFLEKKTADLTRWCRGGVQATPLILMAVQDLATNPATRDATPQSVYNALLACAVTGLEPGPLKQEAFLVPFKRQDPPNSGNWITEVKFLVGWRGIVKQATRAGGIRWIRSAVVREGDHFVIDHAADLPIQHRPLIGTAQRPIIGAWALAKLSNGEYQHAWLDIEDLRKIREHAEKKKESPAWRDWPDEMARKSACRRLGKYLPMDDTYFAGQRIEDAQYADEGPSDLEVIDVLTEGAATADAASGGPIAGFTAPTVLDGGKAPARTSKKKPDAPIEAKATEVKDPPPAAASPPSAPPGSPPSSSPSSSASSPSATTASTSPASSPPTASSSSATVTTAPRGRATDEDAGMANEAGAAGDSDFADVFTETPPAPTGTPQIHGWPATMAGYAAWVNACKTRTEINENVAPWKTWARDVMKFDPGDKASGRAPSPEIQRMGDLFRARWTELP